MELIYLKEDLGNLAQLGVGNLINMLKQSIQTSYTRNSRRVDGLGPVRTRFYDPHSIGNTSQIVDIGVITSLSDIKNAYKKQRTDAKGFALYIGDKAIALGIFNEEDFGHAARRGALAFDLTAFKPIIDKFDQEDLEARIAAKKSWEKPALNPTTISTARESNIAKYIGTVYSTAELKSFIENLVSKIAEKVNQPIKAKLILADVTADEKRQKRSITRNQLTYGLKDLRTRLAIYKNQKKPTVHTIEGFIEMSLRKPGQSVQFAGLTYSLVPESHVTKKLTPVSLLYGQAFKIGYSSTDPGSYDAVYIQYQFSRKNNQLIPVSAEWIDRTDNGYTRKEGILDPKRYVRIKFGNKSKDEIIKELLVSMKKSLYTDVLTLVDVLKRAGYDWPELDVIYKSAFADVNRKK